MPAMLTPFCTAPEHATNICEVFTVCKALHLEESTSRLFKW